MAGATIERFGMVTSLSLEVQGPGSAYILRISVLPIVWGVYIYIYYIGIIFQGLVNSWIFPSFSVLNIHIFGKMSYHSDERAFHNSLVASHHPLRRAARFHQFVFLTHLRLKP